MYSVPYTAGWIYHVVICNYISLREYNGELKNKCTRCTLYDCTTYNVRRTLFIGIYCIHYCINVYVSLLCVRCTLYVCLLCVRCTLYDLLGTTYNVRRTLIIGIYCIHYCILYSITTVFIVQYTHNKHVFIVRTMYIMYCYILNTLCTCVYVVQCMYLHVCVCVKYNQMIFMYKLYLYCIT